MKKESLFEKIKNSIKAIFVIYQLVCTLAGLIAGGITWFEFLTFNGAVVLGYLGIREYGKQYRKKIDITGQGD